MPGRRDGTGLNRDGATLRGGRDPYSLDDSGGDDEDSDRGTAVCKGAGVTVGKRRVVGGSEVRKQASLPMLFSRENKKLQAARLVPAGMVNLGNTCYLNSVVQVLVNMATFTIDLKDPALERLSQHLPGGGVWAALRTTVDKLRTASQARPTFECMKPAVEPAELRAAMGRLGSRWRTYAQQDAHEFLVELLEGLQTEVLMAEAAATGRRRMALSETRCPAARNMSGSLKHTWTCSACGHCTRAKEPFSCLSLQLPTQGAVNLQDLVSEYLKDETIDKNCDKCSPSAPVPHTVQHHFWRLPRLLVVHIKRFMPLQQQAPQQGPQQGPCTQQLQAPLRQGSVDGNASWAAVSTAAPAADEPEGMVQVSGSNVPGTPKRDDAGASREASAPAEGARTALQSTAAAGGSRDSTSPAPYLYAKVHTVVKVTAGLDLARFCDDTARVHAHLLEGLSREAGPGCGVVFGDAATARAPGAATGCTLDTAGGGSTCPSPSSMQPNIFMQERTVQQQGSVPPHREHLRRTILGGAKATTPGGSKLRAPESECGTSAVSTGAQAGGDDGAPTPYGGAVGGLAGLLGSLRRQPGQDLGRSLLGVYAGGGGASAPDGDGMQLNQCGAAARKPGAGPGAVAQVTPRLAEKGVGVVAVASQPTPEAFSVGMGLSSRTGNDGLAPPSLPPNSTARGASGSAARGLAEDTVACSERKAPRPVGTAAFFRDATGAADIGGGGSHQHPKDTPARPNKRICIDNATDASQNRQVADGSSPAPAPVTAQRLEEMTEEEQIQLALQMSLAEDMGTASGYLGGSDDGVGTRQSSGGGAAAVSLGVATGSRPADCGGRKAVLDLSIPTAAAVGRLAYSGAGSGAAGLACASRDSAGGGGGSGGANGVQNVGPCDLEEGGDNDECVELQDESQGGCGAGRGWAVRRASFDAGSSGPAMSGASGGVNNGVASDCSTGHASPTSAREGLPLTAPFERRRVSKRRAAKLFDPEDVPDAAEQPAAAPPPSQQLQQHGRRNGDSGYEKEGGDRRVHGGRPIANSVDDEDDGTTALSPVSGGGKRTALAGTTVGSPDVPAAGARCALVDTVAADVDMVPVKGVEAVTVDDEDDELKKAMQLSMETFELEEKQRLRDSAAGMAWGIGALVDKKNAETMWERMLSIPEPSGAAAAGAQPGTVAAGTSIGCSTPKRDAASCSAREDTNQLPLAPRRRSASNIDTCGRLGNPECSGDEHGGRDGAGIDALVAAAGLDSAAPQVLAEVDGPTGSAATARRPLSVHRRNSSSAGEGNAAGACSSEQFKFGFSLPEGAARAQTGATAAVGLDYGGAGCRREDPLDLTGGGDDEDPDLAKAIMLSLQAVNPQNDVTLDAAREVDAHEALDLAGMESAGAVMEHRPNKPKVVLMSDSEYEGSYGEDVAGNGNVAPAEAAAAGGSANAPAAHGSARARRRKGGATGDAAVPVSLMARYRLHGVVRHKGLTPFSGHYVADVLVPNPAGASGQAWYEHNDAVVSHVDFDRVREDASKQGYLFFFVNAPKPAPSLTAIATAAALPLPGGTVDE